VRSKGSSGKNSREIQGWLVPASETANPSSDTDCQDLSGLSTTGMQGDTFINIELGTLSFTSLST
jgi:hypothetical protein